MVDFYNYHKAIIWDSGSIYAHVRCDNLRQIKLVEMVNHLSTSVRQAILLYTFENMPKATIAVELGKNPSEIRRNMSKANDVMRQFADLLGEPTVQKLFLNKLFKQWPYQTYAELLRLKTNAVIVR